MVSVPLRGCGFKIYFSLLWVGDVRHVSVPLRGCGFKILKKAFLKRYKKTFPSPCGDVVLKLHRSLSLAWLQYCFRPLAGMWF